ncbi:MAG: hypothetical protein KME59_20535 [Trichormus sp. ATA11-4-KO1]|uniref:Uncharacterized protein n=1 Tax=Nostoc minutum NIES-26 TaxID=1844469 RepID=A0A367RWD0_9NOSO|nr:hypothetical protein [Trichormus sp. ATA11-4-KO1]RCJ40926.1 hypothetical protein A6770_36930 [Nostoc minutum NIES-26]
MKQSTEAYYRQTYQAVAGEVSNRRWRNLRGELERSGMTITVSTLRMFAKFKNQFPRTPITKQALKTYERFQQDYQDTQEFSGNELLEILRKIKPNVTDRMLINAFYKSCLHFSKQKIYSYSEACKVVFFTTITRSK